MFEVIETLISDLDLEVCDSISVPARRTSRARLPDSFTSGPAGKVPLRLFPRVKGRLYKHQSQALRHLSAGRNVVISTGTASGKSLAFQLHAMNRLLENPRQQGSRTLSPPRPHIRPIWQVAGHIQVGRSSKSQAERCRHDSQRYAGQRTPGYSGGSPSIADDA